MSWVPSGTCTGSDLDDKLPFRMPGGILELCDAKHCTNAELWDVLDPTNVHLPYIYDSLDGWGECSVDWDQGR